MPPSKEMPMSHTQSVPTLLAALCLGLMPSLSGAQSAAPVPAFPPDAQPVAPEVLKERLTGKSFFYRTASGGEVRLQFKSDFVYVNAGPTNDSGRWRAEGSQMCIEWNRIPNSGCSEARMLGNTVYLTRVATAEVIQLEER
jgi:hypothetical protein